MRFLVLILLAGGLLGCGQQLKEKGQSPPAVKPVAAKPARQSVEIAWGGDLTPGSQYGLPPNHGRELLAAASPRLSKADIAAVNLEGTLSEGGASKCAGAGANCFAFQAPVKNVAALTSVGIDIVNLANNHSNDFGSSGMRQTRQTLKKKKIKYSGLPEQITYLRRGGNKIAFVGFAPYRWTAPLNNLRRSRSLVKRADRQADIIVVFFHGGAEGSDKTRVPYGSEIAFGENRGDLRQFTRAMVDTGADLVVGSGPHVLRGMEVYRSRLIAYSLANLAGYHNFGTGGASALSGIISVKLDPSGRAESGRFLSLRLDQSNIPRSDKSRAAASLVSSLSRADFARRGVKITSSGRLVLP